jgi:predicted ester cyclase
MSSATNIELARRTLAAFDASDASVVAKLVHPDYREHAGLAPVPGRDGVRESIGWLSETFANRRTQVEDLIASGDRVVARVRFTGTHVGELWGIAATGRRIATGHIHIWRVADGRLAEHWMAGDELSMLKQLGVIGAPR